MKNYKNIEECAIALNPKFIKTKLSYMPNNALKIELIENNNNVSVFNQNLNIVAIVGQNGSGKSNLSSAIATIVRLNSKNTNNNIEDNYYDNTLPEEYCLVYRNNNKYYYLGDTNYEIISPKRTKAIKGDIESKCAIFKPFLIEPDEEVLNFPKDLHQDEIIDKKLDNYFYYDRFRIYDTAKSLRNLFDIGKNLKVLNDPENSNLIFDSYGYEIDIKQEFSWLNRQLLRAQNSYFEGKNNELSRNSYLFKFINLLIERNRIISRNIKTMKNFDLAITAGCFSFGIIQIITSASKIYGCKEILGHYQDLKKLLNLLKLKKGLLSRHGVFKDFWNKTINILSNSIQKQDKDCIKKTNELIDLFNIFRGNEEKLYYNKLVLEDILKTDGKGLFRLKKTVNISDEIPLDIDALNKLKIFRLNFYKKANNKVYSFFELSTGEQRILRLFADILSTIDKADTFILDEMDLSWHPEWQRKMVYYIHDLFAKLCKKRNINIIFTTHSPFILSDIPKENVIIMNKGKASFSDFETFASNIHDLFNKNLFLNCGDCYTIGEFAKEKIEKIAKELSKKNISEKKLCELEEEINVIGEPIIRTSLLNKLYSNPYYIKNDESSAQLRTKIFELKRMLNAKN